MTGFETTGNRRLVGSIVVVEELGVATAIQFELEAA
jgi:hypothetical protein